ncbi:MAG: hypothetical protein K2I70_04610, partial [Bacilli bacterium]|nr:hypothetical protein [Bacilli bacterium]
LRYMALCDNESSNDLLYNKTVIEGYSAKDHLAIMDMADNVRTKSTEVKDIFFASISNQCPSDTIRIIIKSLDNRLTDTNKGEIVRLLTNEAFYELYPSVDMIDIISVILSMQDARVIGVLVDIALAGAWMNGKYGLDFKDVATLVPYTSDTNKLLLEKEATYQLEYEDIIEMLDITKDASHLITLFTNDFAREHLTHEQMISLVQEFDLGDLENFDSYATALSIAIKMGIKDSLYQDLRNSLAKDIYETTVGEYLATCNSITEFVRTLERECGENVSVDPNAFLNLKLK